MSGFRRIYITRGGGLGIYMPAGRLYERAKLCLFSIFIVHCFNFPERGQSVEIAADFYNLRRCFW